MDVVAADSSFVSFAVACSIGTSLRHCDAGPSSLNSDPCEEFLLIFDCLDGWHCDEPAQHVWIQLPRVRSGGARASPIAFVYRFGVEFQAIDIQTLDKPSIG